MTTKEWIQYGTAVFMLLFGVCLCIAGFIVNPLGVVDDSILCILGQCILYAGSIFGIAIFVKDQVLKDLRKKS